MLPRHLRLRRNEDFQIVRRQGKRQTNAHLGITVLRSDLPHSRFGFVVGKRVGKAVTRNQVKRRLRAIARQINPRLRHHADIVVVAHPAASEASFADLEKAFGALLKRTDLLNEIE